MSNNVEEKFFRGKNESYDYMFEDRVKGSIYTALGDYNGEDRQRLIQKSWEEIVYFNQSIMETCLKIKEHINNAKK